MQFSFGSYTIKIHELDQKLSVQVTSDLGEVRLNNEDHRTSDVPNDVCFYIENPIEKPEAKGLKRFAFGDYTFILGINYAGELFLFHQMPGDSAWVWIARPIAWRFSLDADRQVAQDAQD